LLPDDSDEGASEYSPEAADQGPRAVGAPIDEFQGMLALAKRGVDLVVANYPMKIPGPKTALELAELLKRLFNMTVSYQRIETGAARRQILQDLQIAAITASAAAMEFTEKGLSVNKKTECFLHLHELQRQVDAALLTYRPQKG
jgi:hypothetical protein